MTTAQIARPFDALIGRLETLAPPAPAAEGRVLRYDGLIVETTGFPASPGAICRIDRDDAGAVEAEMVGFRDGRNLLFLTEPQAAIVAGARVRLQDDGLLAEVGEGLLGRAVDARGLPLDGGPAPRPDALWPLHGRPINPLARTAVNRPLDVGVRVINAVLTMGEGQRIGIMAGSGVGKSVLVEMMAQNADADVVVLAMIGERAREVGHFARALMQGEAGARTCLVAVPADRSPLLRLRGVRRAMAMAEWFRSTGRRVLLVIDSLTRVAHAQREIGLALGEQPTARGHTPSVVAMIPALLERAGPGLPGEGTITAICTVLADGDDVTADPVVDTARAILDGHIVLSRKLAQQGLYPAIDITQSVSRVMPDVTDAPQRRAAQRLRELVAAWMDNRDLVMMGGYVAGQDATLDAALRLWPRIFGFLGQNREARVSLHESHAALRDILDQDGR